MKELYSASHGETEAHGSVVMKNSIAKPFACFLSKCNQNSSSKMGRKTQGHTENHSEIVTQHTLQVATCLGTVSPCPLLLSVFQKSHLLLLTGRQYEVVLIFKMYSCDFWNASVKINQLFRMKICLLYCLGTSVKGTESCLRRTSLATLNANTF